MSPILRGSFSFVYPSDTLFGMNFIFGSKTSIFRMLNDGGSPKASPLNAIFCISSVSAHPDKIMNKNEIEINFQRQEGFQGKGKNLYNQMKKDQEESEKQFKIQFSHKQEDTNKYLRFNFK